MPLIQARDQSIFFAHVPKTGGSSVEDHLVRRFGGTLSLRDVKHRSGRLRRGRLSPVTHLTPEDLLDLLPHDVDYSSAVVRNPLQRVVSQYRFQCGVSWTTRFSFSTWLRIMMRCAAIDARVYHNHIRPQSDLVPENAEVFRLEDGFDSMIIRLDEIAGTSAPDIHVGHLLKGERFPITINRDDVRLIEAYYMVDYDRFGYEREDTEKYTLDFIAQLRNMTAHVLAPVIVYRQRRHWLR